MSTTNRSARITKLFSLLKKRYKPLPAPAGRNLFEHFLYACLLEDGSQDVADEGIARLEQDYFDWNEVRVTTVSELAESFTRLPNATEAASRLKKNLHSLFETYYSFDIEELKKQNLGKTVKDLSEFPAMTPFVLAYLVQQGLGGHAIPVNSTGLDVFYYCGIITDEERVTRKVPGIERAISKAKGVEFSSLLHQLSLEFAENPKDPDLRKLILQINPDAEEILPGSKRPASKPSPAKKGTKKTAKKADEVPPPDNSRSKPATKISKAKKAAKAPAKKTPSKPKTAKHDGVSSAAKKSGKAATAGRSSTKKLAKKKPR